MPHEFHYDPDELYSGEVIDQLLTTDRRGVVQLVLTVSVTGRVKDAKDPAGTAVPCPAEEVEVWLTFAESDDRLDIPLRHLEKLGYPDVDLARLHPGHAGCHLLTGVKVYVRPKEIKGLTYWNLAWPREKPKAVGLGAIQDATKGLAAKLAAARTAKPKPAPGTTNRPAAGGKE